jgi:predicted unusual protein kinase regulating ubiquinone biosynthesis (AarF/ABC1/UbiB family)
MPEQYTTKLSKLHDNVPPISPEDAKKILEVFIIIVSLIA